MKTDKPLTDINGEVRELNAAEIAEMKPLSEVNPALLSMLKKEKKVRGAQKEPTKERVTIRLSQDVLEHFRSTGKGWQGRVDEALKSIIAK